MEYKISEKKKALISKFKESPLSVGEKVYVTPSDFEQYGSKTSTEATIKEIDGDEVVILFESYTKNTTAKINKSLIKGRVGVRTIGANPFVEKYRNVRPVAYSMDSIIFTFELIEKRREEEWEIVPGVIAKEVNWNPFIYDKDGNKQYYQRDFVWSLEQKQRLIDSIYKGICCGMLLVRKRSWSELEKMAKNGEKELSFTDIVDGKQRLNAIKEFLNDGFPDSYGNYFSDLSNYSQYKFTDHQLFQYAEMENVTDEETLFQFLKMNHEGVPQSKEHLDFVAKLLK